MPTGKLLYISQKYDNTPEAVIVGVDGKKPHTIQGLPIRDKKSGKKQTQKHNATYSKLDRIISKSADSHLWTGYKKTLKQCWFNAGPASATLAQH